MCGTIIVPPAARWWRVIVAGLVAVSACAPERSMDPSLAGDNATAQFGSLAFTATVNPRARSVTIVPPAASAATSIHGLERPNLSLLGNDVVRLVPSNLRMSALGAVTPNKIRVTFDVTIENKLPTLGLIAPTWPTPPAPYVIMFPLNVSVTAAPGGVAGGDGNTIGVGLPGAGQVVPSENWDGTGVTGSGAPYSFFNNTTCGERASSGCFRWVAFGDQLQSGVGRLTRTVGFDIDASVAQFRARMIVAADLVPTVPVAR
jgi:hypothetical protein